MTDVWVRALGLAGAALVLDSQAPLARAQGEPPRLFVLPVRGGSWPEQEEQRLLEARVTLALTSTRRVRPVGARDLPASVQKVLPADLAACVTPACLRTLGKATGAARVLALELYGAGPGPTLFATLYHAGTGEALDRRELPRPAAAPATRFWAQEVARWIASAPPEGAPPGPAPEPPPRARAVLLSVAPAAAPVERPEAQALANELTSLLSTRGRPPLALGGPAPITHHALITVEKIAVSQRPRHVRHYRTGLLTATLTISEAPAGAVIFSKRAAAEITARARHASEQQLVAALVKEVVSRWMSAFDEQSLDQRLQRRASP